MPSPNDPVTIPGETELIELLAHLYRAVDWSAIGGKGPVTIWGGRVLVASRAATIGEMANRIASTLNLTAIPHACVPLIAECRKNERALLNLLAAETIPLATASYLRARDLRAERVAAKQEALPV